MASKMRMVYPYPKGRSFQNEDRVTFKPLKELKLKDRVWPEKNFKVTKCISELGVFLTCLKENSFMEKECLNELRDFNECSIKAAIYKTDDEATMDSEYISQKPVLDVEKINKMFKMYKK